MSDGADAKRIKYALGALGAAELVRRLGLERAKGKAVRVKCPAHTEGNPSCAVDYTGGAIVVFCRSCRFKGSALDLVAKVKGLDIDRDFPAVLAAAAAVAGVDGPAERRAAPQASPPRWTRPSPSETAPAAEEPLEPGQGERDYPPADEVRAVWEAAASIAMGPDGATPPHEVGDALAWLQSRGLSAEIVAGRDLARVLGADVSTLPPWARAWGGGVVVQLFDVRGVLRSLRSRYVGPDKGPETPKSLAPRGYRMAGLMMLDPVARAALEAGRMPEGADPTIAVAEGEPDFLTLATCDPRGTARTWGTVGIPGSPGWSDAWARAMPRGTVVAVWTDADDAGRRYAGEIVRTMAESGARSRVLYRPEHAPGAALPPKGTALDVNALHLGGNLPAHPCDGLALALAGSRPVVSAADVLHRVTAAWTRPEVAISTGSIQVDRLLGGGLRASGEGCSLVSVSGAAKVGKTSWLLQVGFDAVRRAPKLGEVVTLALSCELSEAEQLARVLARCAFLDRAAEGSADPSGWLSFGAIQWGAAFRGEHGEAPQKTLIDTMNRNYDSLRYFVPERLPAFATIATVRERIEAVRDRFPGARVVCIVDPIQRLFVAPEKGASPGVTDRLNATETERIGHVALQLIELKETIGAAFLVGSDTTKTGAQNASSSQNQRGTYLLNHAATTILGLHAGRSARGLARRLVRGGAVDVDLPAVSRARESAEDDAADALAASLCEGAPGWIWRSPDAAENRLDRKFAYLDCSGNRAGRPEPLRFGYVPGACAFVERHETDDAAELPGEGGGAAPAPKRRKHGPGRPDVSHPSDV